MSQLHQETEAQLTAEKKQNESLLARLSRLASDSQQASLTLSKRAEDAERELRWAREGRKSAEVREELVRKELETLRYGLESSSASGGADPQRIKELEGLLEQYKKQLEEMSRDSRDVESRLAGGKGLVKRSELEDEQARVKALRAGKFKYPSETTIKCSLTRFRTRDAEPNDRGAKHRERDAERRGD